MHRIALAMARGPLAGKARVRDPSGETLLRSYVFDDAFAPNWDESILGGARPAAGPTALSRMSREIIRHQSEYDAVVTWGEKLTLAMLLQQSVTRRSKPHVAMMYQFEKANIRLPLKVLKRHLHAVVTWSSVQRRALIDRLGFPAERVYLIRHYVDQVFYSPRTAEEDMICAVGAEMRDYETFKAAIRGTGIRCHVAADHVRIPGTFAFLGHRRVPIDQLGVQPSSNVTQGRKALTELRSLYARSRFVVVPLMHSNTDNGVTVILEAMSMGKPVICSRTQGQVDVIQEGVTGLYVPVGDAAAMRAAILSLWNEPERARQMGLRARQHVEKYHTLEKFTATTRSAAEASLAGRPAPETWWDAE